MKTSAFLAFGTLAMPMVMTAADSVPSSMPAKKTNIIYILCDDLGIGEVGCYGQTKIKTPNIDKLRAEGMLFTQHYSGSTVCAPSRCSLMTGLHTGHTYIRGNRELAPQEGQAPIPANTVTIAKLLKDAGYTTACIGKWGLGDMEGVGSPLKQGFDHFFGYNCQRHAHSYYTDYLWNDNTKMKINDGCAVKPHQTFPKNQDPNNPDLYKKYIGKDYTPDLMNDDAIRWLKNTNGKPFFLYFATPLPHVSLQAPDSYVAVYKDQFNDTPYSAERGGYLPTRYPRATYAAMVGCIDRYVGDIMKTVKELGLDDNTIIMFCSDNGPTFNGGTQSAYFNSAQGYRGLKCSLYEGGVRTPFLVRWPGKIQPNSKSEYLSAMWDFFPTACDIAGIKTPVGLDGISLLPVLTGKGTQKTHDYLYWEDNCQLQAIRQGDFKAIRFHPSKKAVLFDLAADPHEENNIAEANPDMLDELLKKMDMVRTESELFPLVKPGQKKYEFHLKQN